MVLLWEKNGKRHHRLLPYAYFRPSKRKEFENEEHSIWTSWTHIEGHVVLCGPYIILTTPLGIHCIIPMYFGTLFWCLLFIIFSCFTHKKTCLIL